MQIYDDVLNSWKGDQLINAQESLTVDFSWSTCNTFQNSSHHILASRALIRARLRKWDEAMTDAKEVFDARLLHTVNLIPIFTSPSKSCHPLLATSQRV